MRGTGSRRLPPGDVASAEKRSPSMVTMHEEQVLEDHAALASYVRALPKVELHVHMEGSIRPETLLVLAQRNRQSLPARTVEDLRAWYAFTDFSHFVAVYRAIVQCLHTPDDIELIAREFLAGQAEQNVLHSEVTYTAYWQWHYNHIPFREQLAAINRARTWARQTLGVAMTLTIDIPRDIPPEEGLLISDWAITGMGNGVTALGLGGPEQGNPPEKFKVAFERARAAGLASVPHAGETTGPDSIWGALRFLHADRIGHGIRCLEDPALVRELRAPAIPLEVCPTSNICLAGVASWEEHPLPRLLSAGLCVTLNSDDPPMFGTTITEEYLRAAITFGLQRDTLEMLATNALRASLLATEERRALEGAFRARLVALSG